MRMLGMLHEAL
jgi:tetratricopeptide (TPR) repeat protein